MDSGNRDSIKDIPIRLRQAGRPIQMIHLKDRLYMRHPALPAGMPYGYDTGAGEESIPGHDNLEDQSVNSHRINLFGTPRDVLFDIRKGAHYWNHQIACFVVGDIRRLNVPNEKSIQRRPDGTPRNEPNRFTFVVQHSPNSVMYPHCEILAKRDGREAKKVAPGVKTAIRSQFAKLAEQRRAEMLSYYRPGIPVRCRFVDRGLLWYCMMRHWLMGQFRRST